MTTNIYINNEGIDLWNKKIGVNTIPTDTIGRQPLVSYERYLSELIPEEIQEQWKREGKYDKGISIIPGRIWQGPCEGQYLIAIDCDNKKAIDEICNALGFKDILELSNWTVVEQHEDSPNKAHIYIRSTKPFKKKSSDKVNRDLANKIDVNDIPAIEVKGSGEHGIMFVSPSIHKDGYPYRIIGTKVPALCDELESLVDNICKKYRIPYLESNNVSNISQSNNNKNLIPIEELFKPDTRILKGHNRHEAVLRVAESLIQRKKNILSLDQIKKLAYEWNQEHCIPPLDDKEFERQWNDALDFTTKTDSKVVVNKLDNGENDNSNSIPDADTGLLEKIKEHCIELFVDQYNNPHVSIKIDIHVEVLSLNGRRFKNLLYKIFYNETKKLNSEKIEGILNILKADAEFSGNIKKLDLRVAKTDDYTFYYDLTDKNWRAIKITPNGWNLEEGKETPIPILFKRYSNQKPQVIPEIYDKSDIFDKFMDLLNLKDEKNRLLLKCYIVSLFIPGIAKPILILHGEQGSAKSTLQELKKMLVDPSILSTLSFPRDINELIQQLAHNYIAYYDNISNIPDWISDLLCRAVTGSGFSKRQLFTDDDDFIYTFKRCVGINGINLGNIKSDLLDRSIIIQLERIPKKKRRKIEDLWKEFEMIKPQLLGYIFHIIVKVLNVKKEKGGGITLPDGFNRMADFEEYSEIISRCMGNEENKFLEAYQENVGIQIDQAIEANPLSTVILQFMNRRDITENDWEGTATQLLSILNEFAENELKMSISRIKSWPKLPNKLSGQLNEVITNLREKGIVIERDKDNKGNKIIKICKLSPESSYRQEPADQAQNSNEMFDDTKETIAKVSPKQEGENQAQKNDVGRFGDTDDTLHNLEEKCKEDYANSELYECYYCNKFAPTTDEVKYQAHVLSSHPKKRLYPILSELKEMGIKPKGKRWEK
jgi:hypothetical protein